MCELRSNSHSTVAARQDRPLFVQCLWPLSQDEWAEQAPHPAQETPGKTPGLPLLTQGPLSSSSRRTHTPYPFPIHTETQLCTGEAILNLPSQAASRNPAISLHRSFHPWLHTGITLGPSLRCVDLIGLGCCLGIRIVFNSPSDSKVENY